VVSPKVSEDGIGVSVSTEDDDGGTVSLTRSFSPVGRGVSIGTGDTDGDTTALSALYAEGLAVAVGI
jgi:hypothetical protein